MEQLELQAHSWESALEADVYKAGGWRKVAKEVLPAKYSDDEERAERHIRNCINPNHAQKFDLSELMLLWKLVRERGHVPVTVSFICTELDLSNPHQIAPEDKKAKLQQDFIQAVGALDRIKSELGRLG